jgi:predicted DNA-binding transcriptional regulator AlpA
MRKIEYRNILKPSVDYLGRCGCLMIDSSEMAEFLGVSQKVMTQLASTDRVPGPCRLGLGTCFRWSVLELLEWVEADCPRRQEWIKQRGQSGRNYI